MKKMDILKGFEDTFKSVRKVYSEIEDKKSFKIWGIITLASLLVLIIAGVL